MKGRVAIGVEESGSSVSSRSTTCVMFSAHVSVGSLRTRSCSGPCGTAAPKRNVTTNSAWWTRFAKVLKRRTNRPTVIRSYYVLTTFPTSRRNRLRGRPEVVRIEGENNCGRVAQLGEHLLCKQGVRGSIPSRPPTICLQFQSLTTKPGGFLFRLWPDRSKNVVVLVLP